MERRIMVIEHLERRFVVRRILERRLLVGSFVELERMARTQLGMKSFKITLGLSWE